MNHSLIGADRCTHVKIVAVALVGAIAITMAGITARLSEGYAATVRASAGGQVLRAGKPAISATRDTTIVR